MSQPVTVIAFINAKPGKEAAVKQALLDLILPTRQEKGCINYDLHQWPEKPGHFVFYENWQNRETLDAHLATAHLRAFEEIAGGWLAEPADIQIWEKIG